MDEYWAIGQWGTRLGVGEFCWSTGFGIVEEVFRGVIGVSGIRGGSNWQSDSWMVGKDVSVKIGHCFEDFPTIITG